MVAKMTGGCACGAIRYEFTGEPPLFSANCHCRDCQRANGGASASFFAMPRAAVKTIGALNFFDFKSESGNTVSRGFCANCGSKVMGTSSGFPDAIVILAGSLDDPSWFKPQMDIWTSSAQPWEHLNPALPKFPKSPPTG